MKGITMKWIIEAKKWLGTKEYPGAANNPTILAWAKRLGARILGINYAQDSVPWCGLFVAHCINAVGLACPAIAVRASEWAKWGKALKAPVQGCVLVFQRPGGGHVGFCVGESKTAFLVLGGNQGDKVCETWIAKDRCVAMRWPAEVNVPRTPPAFYNAAGKLSTNEG